MKEEKKKILFLIPTLGFGGAERVLVNLVNNMDNEMFDVTVQTLFDEGVNKQYLDSKVQYKSFMKHQFQGNTYLFKILPAKLLYKWIIRGKYDIVVSYLEGPTAKIISGCSEKEIKRIAWIHTAFDEKEKYKVGFWSLKDAKKAYEKYDLIVGVSQGIVESFGRISTSAFPPIKVLYNTANSEIILRKKKEEIGDISFDKEVVNICSVGKLTPVKGYDRLINSCAKLSHEGFRFHLYIIGEGESRNDLQRMIEEKSIEGIVSLIGFRDNPYKYVNACDLFVCSSRREGFSTAVTESLIIGTPVVSTNCSGAKEMLGENEFGIVVENTEEGIESGMREMLSDSNNLEYYKQKAFERGFYFSTEKTVKEVEKMLKSL